MEVVVCNLVGWNWPIRSINGTCIDHSNHTITATPLSSTKMSLLIPPPPHLFRHRIRPVLRRIHRRSFSLSSACIPQARLQETSRRSENGATTAVVWFKHDLRIDDHPAIVAASSKHRHVVPIYVFDHRILSRFNDEMVELVLMAVEDLRRSLKEQGSNLIIRFGRVEDILQGLAKEVNASIIYVEEEVEYDLYSLIDTVRKTVAADPALDRSPVFELWHTPFYDIKILDDLPAFYRDLKQPQFDDASLLGVPSVPSCPVELDWGHLPTIDDVYKFMDRHSNGGQVQWRSLKDISAEAVLKKDHLELMKSYDSVVAESRLSSGNSIQNLNGNRRRSKSFVFSTNKGSIVSGGTKVVLHALAGYLRYLEGTARDDWQEVHEKLRETEKRSGSSFLALFEPALQLGVVSRRRVHYEAIKYEKERNAGFLSPFGYSTVTVSAAIDAVCSIEWYSLLSLKNQRMKGGSYPNRVWRWKGNLIQYTVFGCEGPAVLFVHGFGAFYEHYRDNICNIGDGGNRVWAITLLGFGKSDKPNVVYSELMWAELLRDFIIEVVGQPAHLVGNSIGGYFISIVGGLWPSLVKSIVLLNTAGNVIPGYSSLLFSKERQISGAAWLGARALIQYLRLSTGSLVKNCYPTRPERADDSLINEMIRASYDPGSFEVLESVFSFNLNIPLNHLLSKLEDKVLILQGMKDPIDDSYSKLAMFRDYCKGIVIKELDAGHCPHDECPEVVNPIICDWILSIEGRICSETFDSSLSSNLT